MSASPDQFIECECCGSGLIEIKCPFVIRDTAPSPEKLKQLEKIKEKDEIICKLKKNHDHFYQIQGQMGITDTSYCWYFVYTEHGHYMEKIIFDNDFFRQMLSKLLIFWNDHFAKELLFGRPRNDPHTNNNDISVYVQPVTSTPSSEIAVDFAINPPKNTQTKERGKRKGKTKVSTACVKQPIYMCSICKQMIPYIANNFEENSISCEFCEMWYHFKCVKIINEEDIPSESDSWFCDSCKETLTHI